VPVIYTCFIGYDVVGHHSGPLSRNSLRVLRGIDGAIRKLFDTRQWAERRYEIVLLSDHGMTPCQPVAEAFDRDFESWIAEWWRHGAQATPRYRAARRRIRQRQRRPARPPARRRGAWLGRLAGNVARRGSGWLRTWGRIGAWTLELGSAGAIKLGERFLEEESEPPVPRVAVVNCGPLCQLWVRDVDRRLDLGEVEALCPGFLAALAAHPAVGLVVGRMGDAIVARGRSGTVVLRPSGPRHAPRGTRPEAQTPGGPAGGGDGRTRGEPHPAPAAGERAAGPAGAPGDTVVRVEGSNPLAQYEEPEVAARQIAAFAMEACGDVICFAALFTPGTLRDSTPGAVGETHVYSFENQLGTHASLGGDQSYPFIMLPARVRFDPRPIVTASDLHPFLRSLVRPPAAAPRGEYPADVHRTRGPQRGPPGKVG
jgi:hypothetical protein